MNLSRVDPSTLTAADNRVCDKTTRKTVACVMTGFVSNWDLDTAMERPNSRNPEQPLRVHQVTIVPFTQFFRREMAVWGEILGFTRITGTIFVEGMGFTTRSEQGDGQTSQNATTSVSSAPPSPGKILPGLRAWLIYLFFSENTFSCPYQVPCSGFRCSCDSRWCVGASYRRFFDTLQLEFYRREYVCFSRMPFGIDHSFPSSFVRRQTWHEICGPWFRVHGRRFPDSADLASISNAGSIDRCSSSDRLQRQHVLDARWFFLPFD